MQKQDLYDVLKVSKNASQEEIKKAFKKQAIEFHPDKTSGDKDKEEQFKLVNEAYSVLSDPQKKEMYDRFGVVDGVQPEGPPADLADMLKNMFGGGGMPMPGGGGFSFMFGGGGGDPFGNIFGGNHAHQGEVIDVPVSLSEIYHGSTKKIEFELLDMCHKCNGTGAQDPSQVLKCMMCKGEGKMTVQINPIMVTTVMCESCGGNGTTVKNNRFCLSCKGRKTQYTKKTFEIAIPKGITHGHIVKMPNKGSWNETTKQYNPITFRVLYDVKPPFSVSGADVSYTMDVSLDDLLCGFEKEIDLYGEKVKVQSTGYFNPAKPHVSTGKGLPSKKGNGNLIINWRVIYDDSHRLSRYNDVFQKVLKRKPIEIEPSAISVTPR